MKKLLFIGLVFVLFAGIVACGSGGNATTETNIEYEIVNDDDTSIAGAVRASLDVLIAKGNYSDEEIENLLKHIVETYSSQNKINGMTVFLYDDRDDIGWGYTVGKAEFWPHGNKPDASTVTAGDYKTFQLDIDIK